MTRNVDDKTAGGFGREWSTFTQSDRELTAEQRARLFADYFAIFPWETLPAQGATGIDVGCGSGRWAALVAPRVARLHLLDVSAEALDVARANLANVSNVSFHLAAVEDIPLPDGSLDFRLFARGSCITSRTPRAPSATSPASSGQAHLFSSTSTTPSTTVRFGIARSGRRARRCA